MIPPVKIRFTVPNKQNSFEISQNIREHLVDICHFMYCAPQRVILREGHHASALYFVLDGEINVSKRAYSIVWFNYRSIVSLFNIENRMQELGKVTDIVQYALVPGDFFGVDGLILGNRRAVTCSTASKCMSRNFVVFFRVKLEIKKFRKKSTIILRTFSKHTKTNFYALLYCLKRNAG